MCFNISVAWDNWCTPNTQINSSCAWNIYSDFYFLCWILTRSELYPQLLLCHNHLISRCDCCSHFADEVRGWQAIHIHTTGKCQSWKQTRTAACKPHSWPSDCTDRHTKSCLGKRNISPFLLERMWKKTGLQGLRWMGTREGVWVSCRDPEGLRMPAYPRAEFLEGCVTSSSNTIGFGSVFRFSHFFHDSTWNDSLK